MPIFIDPDEVHRYVCESDRKLPESEQPVFLLRVPTVREQTAIQDALFRAIGKTGTQGGDSVSVSGEAAGAFSGVSTLALVTCWRGVENWKKKDGSLIDFDANDAGEPSEWMLATLTYTTRIELMNHCMEVMGLTDKDLD